MPIFWLTSVIPMAGRVNSGTSKQWLSMEIAASCPCATAQMMFLGPQAASPPKKTPGTLDCMVTSSTTGISHSPKVMPRSRSIQGKEFSWPMARITSSQGIVTVSMVVEREASSSHSRTSNSMPTSTPFSTTKRVGA